LHPHDQSCVSTPERRQIVPFPFAQLGPFLRQRRRSTTAPPVFISTGTGTMTAAAADLGKPSPHPTLPLLGLTAGLCAILVVLLALFILPSLKSGPHDLPLGLVGTPAAVANLDANLAEAVPGAYVTRSFASADELHAAIAAREV